MKSYLFKFKIYDLRLLNEKNESYENDIYSLDDIHSPKIIFANLVIDFLSGTFFSKSHVLCQWMIYIITSFGLV